jgi:hypothetical protein
MCKERFLCSWRYKRVPTDCKEKGNVSVDGVTLLCVRSAAILKAISRVEMFSIDYNDDDANDNKNSIYFSLYPRRLHLLYCIYKRRL